MRIGELARQTGATPKALRYYEEVGLLEAGRLPNGYRDYDERDVRLVREVRVLGSLGIRADQARPFVECLIEGHEQGEAGGQGTGALGHGNRFSRPSSRVSPG